MEIFQCDICEAVKDVTRERYPTGTSSDGYDGVQTDCFIVDLCLTCKASVMETTLKRVTEKEKYLFGQSIELTVANRRKF